MRASHIKDNEGFRSNPYRCTEGRLTIGYGWNLDAGISKRQAEVIFLCQVEDIEEHLSAYGFWYQLNDARQTVLVDMCFQLGKSGFGKFKKMIAAIHHQNYEQAAIELLDSRYARQTPERAARNAEIMETGNFSKGKVS